MPPPLVTARRAPRAVRPARMPRRGAVLIVTLMVAAIIALVLGGYLSLNLGAARLAQRTFHRTAAFHLAEAGLEEGLWTYNQTLAGRPAAWSGWTVDGGSAWRRYDDFALANSVRGQVKVYASTVSPGANANPTLVALATVENSGSTPVNQMLQVTLRRRSLFAAGLLARDKLVFNGASATFDSWSSDPDGDAATPPLAYPGLGALDSGTVASAADATNLDVRNARLLGYFRGTNFVPQVGPQGFIGPAGTPPGTVDPSRVSGDFRAVFPPITAPDASLSTGPIGSALGVTGAATAYRRPSLILNASEVLTIRGDVTLVLTDPIRSLVIGGHARVTIPVGSSLTVYVAGDVDIAGGGITNANAGPAAFQIWSTATNPARPPSISISGRAFVSAVIYAPEADVRVSGNVNYQGAILARTLVFNGSVAFHYDTALRRLTRHATYGADAWRIIDDPAERAALLPLVDR